ncbi:uncharacterized protein [Channa argus]|uniref:uncharacterized protein n=1 Tax=Channa argus TaxID=215402 RepID=UPI0035220FD4
MTSFSWTAVALLVFAGNCFAAVDQNKLATIVKDMLEKYDPTKQMFSMAVSIPVKKNTEQDYDIDQVFTTENGNKVKEKILSGGVYKEGRIVAAKVIPRKENKKQYIHAEFRVLENFDTLLNNNYYDHDLLLFYVFGSPCYHKCTNEADKENILTKLRMIQKWKHYAFVFTRPFESKNPQMSTTPDQRREALKKLADVSGEANQKLGLENIFRCFASNNQMQCISCSTNGEVADACV